MICDICHEREATIVWTVVVNNQRTELNLCEVCAAKKGLVDQIHKFMDFKDFLPLVSPAPEIANIKCPNCGLTYKGFQDTAKFGCAQCYQVFENYLSDLLQRIHGSATHTGKKIKTSNSSTKGKNKELEFQELKEQLKKAIEKENYEEAARVRDKLKKWTT